MAIRLSCNPVSYGPYAEDAFEHLQSLGMRHVELPVPDKNAIDMLEERLERHGLSPATLQAGAFDIQSPDVSKQFHPFFHAANRLGVGILFVSIHTGGTQLPVIYDRLRRIGDDAGEHGVRIAIETHPDLAESGAVARRTMEAISHPSVGINFDTANIHYYAEGAADTLQELAQVVPWVVSLHLKDYSADQPRQWAFPTLGEGKVDFAGVFRTLEHQGFDGPATLELEGVQGEALTREQMLERVARSVEVARAAMND